MAEERKKYAGMTGAQIERAKAQERGRVVGFTQLRDSEYDEFEAILQGLTVSRRKVKEAMGFAFDHVESSKEVCVCMCAYTPYLCVCTLSMYVYVCTLSMYVCAYTLYVCVCAVYVCLYIP